MNIKFFKKIITNDNKHIPPITTTPKIIREVNLFIKSSDGNYKTARVFIYFNIKVNQLKDIFYYN